MKSELEDFISNNKEAFYSRTPDPAVLGRIQQQMKEMDGKKKEKTPVISLWLRWAVAACFIVMAGGIVYLIMQKTEAPQTVAVTTKKPEPITPQQTIPEPQTIQPSNENDAVPEEPVLTRHTIGIEKDEAYLSKMVLFAKLSDKESPSRRLAAVSQVEEMLNTDTDIIDALAKTLNTDANTNVRLAALDALSKFYREPYVKKKLLSSLKKQKDPMVQIALIELLTKMREASILKQLNQMVSDENTIQAVKDQAYSGILMLRS
jgi:hypothetical protein